MTLLEEAISVAQATNLKIGAIAEVVHIIQLSSLSAIVQAASFGVAPAGAQYILQAAQTDMQ